MARIGEGGANGHGNGHLRDDRRRGLDGPTGRRAGDESSRSGRRFVIVGVVATLAIWGAVYLAFLDWRARYRALAAFGEERVAPLVDPMADRAPIGVEPGAWREAVADTHAMLVALTAAGVLDRAGMEALRSDVEARVARATTPGSARSELTSLWDDLETKAGPLIAPDPTPARAGSRHAPRHPRPPRPALLRAEAEAKARR